MYIYFVTLALLSIHYPRLVETPTGAARRGRCLHRPQAARQCDNLKCTPLALSSIQVADRCVKYQGCKKINAIVFNKKANTTQLFYEKKRGC